MIFYRGSYNDLIITLTSDEPLGIVDTDRVEDYYGIDGQVSLYHVQDDAYYSLAMTEAPSQTPGIDDDVFVGVKDLSTLPDGDYTIRGRVVDKHGNYTILDSVQSPFGNERIIALGFSIADRSLVLHPERMFVVHRMARLFAAGSRNRLFPVNQRQYLFEA